MRSIIEFVYQTQASARDRLLFDLEVTSFALSKHLYMPQTISSKFDFRTILKFCIETGTYFSSLKTKKVKSLPFCFFADLIQIIMLCNLEVINLSTSATHYG